MKSQTLRHVALWTMGVALVVSLLLPGSPRAADRNKERVSEATPAKDQLPQLPDRDGQAIQKAVPAKATVAPQRTSLTEWPNSG